MAAADMASPPPPPTLPGEGYGGETSSIPPPPPPGRFSFLAAPGRLADVSEDQAPSSASPSRFSFLAAQKQAGADVKVTEDNIAEATVLQHKEVMSEVPEVAAAPSAGLKGEPDRLVQALLDSTSDHDSCLEACTALEAGTERSTAMHKRVLALGGVEALVAAMVAHRASSDIQMMACQALQHLAAASSCGGASRIAEAGGCEAMLLAMGSADAENPLLAQAAAHALELVVFGGPVPRERAVKEGAIETLLSALKVYKASADVQQALLATLQTVLERSADFQQIERFANADGIQRVVATLGAHKSDKQVQYWGRLLLQAICNENRDLRAETLRKLHYQGIELEL